MTEWILTSSVLILLVLAVRGLFKNKMKAKNVYALWLIVLVRLLCPVNFGELSFNLLSLAEEGKAQVEERLELKQEVTAPEETGYFWSENGRVVYPPVTDAVTNAQPNKLPAESMPEVKTGSPAVTKEPLAFTFPEFSWEQVLPVVWLAGMIGMAVVIFGVNISFGTTLGMFRKELPAMERKGRGKQKLSVYLADGISSSCLYGMVRPSIYLNRTGMGEQEKTYCVEHEYSHYLQGDMVWSLCRTVCLILHWYNPLVWVAVTLSKKDAELACDERTIERLGEEERYNYGHTLVELVAAQSRAVQMFGMATLMASDKKEVVERVKAITMKKETKIITGLLVAILVVGIGFFVFTGEAKGDQENNKKNVPVATETPVPTMDPALAEFIEKSKEEHSRNALLTYILETSKFPVEGSVLATKLNVRSAAGYDTDRVDILSAGTTVVINAVEQDSDGNYWYAVSYEQKDSKEIKNGYVNSAYLTEAGAVKETIAQIKAANQEMEFPTVGVTTDSLSLRPAPGNEYKKLNYVKEDTSVTILAAEQDKEGNQWYYVGYSWGEGLTAHGYADSSYIIVGEQENVIANRFRLYQSKDANSDYTELINAEHTLSGVVYGGNDWFYTHTWNNQTGWIRYGDYESSDQYIRKMLRITDAEWQSAKEQKEQALVLSLSGTVNYQDISFVDHIRLELKQGEGWKVDLNGDGKKENLYIDENGVFINGERAFTITDACHEYWLLDIDTTDSVCELLNGNGDLYIYDGTTMQMTSGIEEIYFHEDDGVKETFERYFGSLGEFIRIDAHTISFEDYRSEWDGFAIATYCLDEQHNLCLVERTSDIWEREKVPYAGEPFRLYKYCHEGSEYVEVPTDPYTSFTLWYDDGCNWFYVETKEYGSGWVLYGTHDRLDKFLHAITRTTAETWEEGRWSKECKDGHSHQNHKHH